MARVSVVSGREPRRQVRSAATQRAFLDAAREVFAELGFAEASVAEIVRRAGASVGSLYHQFGGKNELFLALYDELDADLSQRAVRAVAEARTEHGDDPPLLFAAGGRAYLEGCWHRREIVRIFAHGDGPPGFDALRRSRAQEWIRQNAILLRAADRSVNRALAVILTTVLGESGREVVACRTRADAVELIDAVVGLLIHLPSSPKGVS